MKQTAPISFSDTDIWVFADFGDYVDAGRVAVTMTGVFVLFPERDFPLNGALPLYPDTHEPVRGMRWATTSDLAGMTDFRIC